MKHNYIKLKLPALLCIISLSASAHDFEVDGIYYNITSNENMTVEVTYRGYYLLFMVAKAYLHTFKKSRVSNARHTVGNRDGGQAAATRESTVSYARHAVANRDGGQAAASRESRASYARHAVGNRDGGQAAASRVFASLFLSAIYILNGRKVVTWIL